MEKITEEMLKDMSPTVQFAFALAFPNGVSFEELKSYDKDWTNRICERVEERESNVV